MMKFWSSPAVLSPPPVQDLRCEHLRAFGQRLEIWHDEAALEVALQRRDLAELYEMFLASRVLPQQGLCLDIGAGAGWFGLAFAAAFPRWQVLCIEADAARYQALQESLERNALPNVLCLQGGFHPEAAPLLEAKIAPNQSLNKGNMRDCLAETLRQRLGQPQLARFAALPGLGGRLASADQVAGDGATQNCPALPAALLTALAPDLVKLEAPGSEAALAQALRQSETGFVTGRLFSHVLSQSLLPADPGGGRQIYLPHGDLVLRRDYEDMMAGRRPGLDVVVAMHNARAFIGECLESLLAEDSPEIRVLVVDDGSSDGSGDLVAETYGDHPRLQLLRKPNGGCASARNHGRVASTASHIAFVDADDRVDPELFSQLLELARYGGFNMVQGGFFPFEPGSEPGSEPGAQERRGAVTGEAGFDPEAMRRLGEIRYALGPSQLLMQGQPSIWRRVYRRDFLDHWRIGFPEHVRAFDDQIFQLLCAQHGGEIAHVFGPAYHYRQHPAQDIKQGDSRHFYSFNMFREVFLRADAEAWPDLQPVLGALLNTLAWSHGALTPELQARHREAAVEFLAMLAKAFGPGLLARVDLQRTGIEGLAFLVNRRLQQMADLPQDPGLLHLEDWRWQPEFIEMQAALDCGQAPV